MNLTPAMRHLFLFLLTSLVPAQSLLLERLGGTSDGFALDFHWAGDVDQDGHDDLWVSSPNYRSFPREGRLALHSGRNGAVMREFFGTMAESLYGVAWAVGADLDGDGTRDLLIGEPSFNFYAGRFRVISGATGLRRYALVGQLRERFGATIAALGDLDGDSVGDFAVGAPGDVSTGGFGRVYVYSGRTGVVIRQHPGSRGGDGYGWGLSRVGDVDGDGIDDLGIGAPSGLPGVVHIMSGRTGTTLFTFTEALPPTGFGSIFSGIGDVDGDGRADLAISRGASFQIVRGSDGTVLRSHPYAQLSLVGGQDFDYDGVPDYLLGERDSEPYSNSAGTLHLFSGRTGAAISVLRGDQAGDQLGRQIRLGGDINRDGRGDLLTGSAYARQGTGMVRVYGRVPGSFRTLGAGCAGTVGVPSIGVTELPRIGAQLVLQVANVRALQPGVLLLGVSDSSWGSLPLPSPLAPFGMPGCTLWMSPDLLEGVSTGLGTARWSGLIPDYVELIGSRLFTQCLVLDPGINTLGVVSSDAAVVGIGG